MVMKTLCAALVAALALGTPLRAEPGPIGEWLMDQPVSLWDMGMTRIRQDAQRASGYLLKDAQLEGVPDAYYDWGANEIVIGYIVFAKDFDSNHENCNRVRYSFTRAITGLGETATSELVKEFLLSKVNFWFAHDGYRSKGRDEDLAMKMAQIIFISVRLQQGRKIVLCKDRILSFEAPSKPLERTSAE